MSEVRSRQERQEPPKSELEPDYVLVFDGEPKSVAANVSKSLASLADNGFYVTVQPGALNSVLVLVRLKSALASDNRSKAVSQLLPWSTLHGVSDSFPWSHGAPSFLNKEPLLVGTEKSVDAVALWDPKTAAVLQLRWLATVNLGAAALLGLLHWLKGDQFSVVYAFAMLFCGTLTAAKWRSLLDVSAVPSVPLKAAKSSSTRRELRRLAFVPLAAVLLLVFAVGQLAVLALEVFLTQMYAGPLQPVAGLIPAGAGVAAAIVYGMINQWFVDAYTQWEGYDTEAEARAVKTQRGFYLDVLLAYLPVVLTAYLYLPFGNKLVGVLPYLQVSTLGRYVPLAPYFRLDTQRLVNQASYFTLQQPIISILTTVVLPEALSFWKRRGAQSVFAREQLQPAFDADQELKLLVINFGHVLVLSPVWPLGALAVIALSALRGKLVFFLLSRRLRKPAPDYSGVTLRQWCANLKFVLLAASLASPTIALMYGQINPSYRTTTYYYDYSTSAMRVPTAIILAVALLGENFVLAVYTTANKFFARFGEAAADEQADGVDEKSIEKDEKSVSELEKDRAWESIDVTKDLEKVLGAKIK